MEKSTAFNSPRARIIGVVIFCLVLYLFSRTVSGPRSRQQSDFDSWLSAHEAAMAATGAQALTPGNNNQSPLPTLTMQVLNAEGDVHIYNISPGPLPEHNARILRLLQLMRESDIFSLSEEATTAASTPLVAITVVSGNKTFAARFHEADIAGRMQALLLLKLFKEYSEQQPQIPLPDKA